MFSSPCTKIIPALFKALKDMPNPAYNQTGQIQSRTYGYADLSAVAETAKVHLFKQGLMVLQPIELGSVHTVIMHSPSGETYSGEIAIPQGITDMQKLGSVITYLRRYLLCSMLGIVGQADDDGASANGLPPWSAGPPPSQPGHPDAPEDAPNGVPPKATFRDSVTEIVKRIQVAKREAGVRAYKKETDAALLVILRDFTPESIEEALEADRNTQVAIYQRMKACAEACELKAQEVREAKNA